MFAHLATVLFVLVALAASAPPPVEDDTWYMAAVNVGECKSEMKLTDDDVKGLEKKTTFSPKAKCLMKCVGNKMELLKNNQINEKEVLEWIEEDRAINATLADKEKQLYAACKATTGSDDCDLANKLFFCARDFAKKNGMAL